MQKRVSDLEGEIQRILDVKCNAPSIDMVEWAKNSDKQIIQMRHRKVSETDPDLVTISSKTSEHKEVSNYSDLSLHS